MHKTWASIRHYFFPHHTNNQRAKLLHPSSVAVIVGFIAVFQLLLRTTSVTAPQVLGYASNIPASEIIRLTNVERRNRSLPELKLNSALSSAAASKAASMFSKNYWAHVSPDGVQPWSFITNAGYSYRYAGENLARDFTTAQAVVDAWIASPSHRENLLSNRYQDIGVAVVDGRLEGRDTTLVVQMFGTPLSATTQPSVTQTAGKTVALGVPAVKAEIDEVAPQPELVSSTAPKVTEKVAPIFPQFEVNRMFTFFLLALIAGVLVIDIITVSRKSLHRWTSNSVAHLVFFMALLVAVFGVLRGQII